MEKKNMETNGSEVLILIDWQNLLRTCETCEEKIKIDEVFGELNQRALERGTLSEIRLFVPNYQLSATPWKMLNILQLKFGVTISVCPTLREGTETESVFKDLVDLEILRWTMKYVHRGIEPTVVVFVSGDGHFLLAANEAKNRGKEVEFWVVNPDTTSQAIFRFQQYREIKTPALPIYSEPNPFIESIERIQKNEGDDNDRKNLLLIKNAADLLAQEEPIDLQGRIDAKIRALQKELNVSEEDAIQILKVLLALGGARIYSVASEGLYIDPASPFIEWMGRSAR